MHPGQIFILLVAARSHLSVVSWRNATVRQSWESGAGPLIGPILETDMRYSMPRKTSLQRYSRAEGQRMNMRRRGSGAMRCFASVIALYVHLSIATFFPGAFHSAAESNRLNRWHKWLGLGF